MSRLSLIICLVALSIMPVRASTYYVSITGNDANNGTHPSTAWRTLRPTMNVDFNAGDSLLLYGGETFTGRLYFDDKDANSAVDPFVISTYGTSSRATILAEDGYGIYVYNSQGIHIENLIIKGSGMNKNTKAGVEFFLDVAGDVKYKNIVLKNLVVSDFGQAGVRVGAWQGNSGYENVLLEDLDVHDNLYDGIQVYGFFSQVGYPHKNVTIRRCKAYNHPGFADPKSIRGNGIVVSNTDGALIEYCVAYENGRDNVHCGGPGGIWAYDANNVTIQFSESYRNATNSSCDGLGFDLDGGVTNSVIQYCYSHDNAGGGYLLGQYDGARPWANNTCRYNISVNDGRKNASAITVFKGGTTTTIRDAYIYNNTIYTSPSASNPELAGIGITKWNPGIENVRIYNNVIITTGNVPHVRVPVEYEAHLAGNVYWSPSSSITIDYQGTIYRDLNSLRLGAQQERVDGKPTGWIGDPRLVQAGYASVLWPAAPETIPAYAISSPLSRAFNGGVDVQRLLGKSVGTRDLAGNDIPAYGLYDVGAIEYVGDTTGSWMNDTTGGGTDTTDNGGGTSVYDATGRLVSGVFPNPTNGAFTLVSPILDHANSVVVTSLLGERIMSLAPQGLRISIDGTHLDGGMYLVRLLDRHGSMLSQHTVVIAK